MSTAAQQPSQPPARPARRRLIVAELGIGTIMVCALVGVLAGMAVFLFDAPGPPPNKALLAQPATFLWFITLVGQWALWSVVVAPLVSEARNITGEMRASASYVAARPWSRFAAAIVALLALVGLLLLPTTFDVGIPPFLDPWPFWSVPSYPLGHRTFKIGVQTGMGVVVALLVVSAIWLVGYAAHLQLRDLDSRPAGEVLPADVAAYFRRRAQLQTFLWVGGAVLFLATLSVGALRAALVAAKVPGSFPPEFPLVYGSYLTVLYSLVYIPSQLKVDRLGKSIRDRLCPPLSRRSGAVPLTTRVVVDWHTERESLAQALRLRSRAEALRGLAFLFVPLGGSLVSLLLGK
jgi:hypothetical protein